jgi:hypothetical protein
MIGNVPYIGYFMACSLRRSDLACATASGFKSYRSIRWHWWRDLSVKRPVCHASAESSRPSRGVRSGATWLSVVD